jgi:hypothetical protein
MFTVNMEGHTCYRHYVHYIPRASQERTVRRVRYIYTPMSSVVGRKRGAPRRVK